MGLIQTLVAAAGSPTNDLADLGLVEGTDGGFADELATLLEEDKKEARKASAREAMALLRSVKDRMDESLSVIRNLRSEVRIKVNRVKDLERARDFGLETHNFVPLAKIMGKLSVLEINWAKERGTAVEVPEDWKPKAKATAPAAPAAT